MSTGKFYSGQKVVVLERIYPWEIRDIIQLKYKNGNTHWTVHHEDVDGYIINEGLIKPFVVKTPEEWL